MRIIALSLCASAVGFNLGGVPSRTWRCRLSAAADEAVADETVADESSAEAAAAEDPLAGLRADIAEKEGALREKRLELSRIRDLTKDLGQAGLYRLAAEVETFKRNSKDVTSQTTEFAKRDVLRALISVVEKFEEVSAGLEAATDAERKIVADFDEVYKGFVAKFDEFGLESFDVAPGARYDAAKHDLVETDDETTSEQDYDTVVTMLRSGFVLKTTGDVVRRAECTVAKKSVAKNDEEQEEEEQQQQQPPESAEAAE